MPPCRKLSSGRREVKRKPLAFYSYFCQQKLTTSEKPFIINLQTMKTENQYASTQLLHRVYTQGQMRTLVNNLNQSFKFYQIL